MAFILKQKRIIYKMLLQNRIFTYINQEHTVILLILECNRYLSDLFGESLRKLTRENGSAIKLTEESLYSCSKAG